MGWGAWWATVHGLAKSWTRLSVSHTHTHTHSHIHTHTRLWRYGHTLRNTTFHKQLSPYFSKYVTHMPKMQTCLQNECFLPDEAIISGFESFLSCSSVGVWTSALNLRVVELWGGAGAACAGRLHSLVAQRNESSCDAGATGGAALIPGPRRCPREWHGKPLQYSCLGNPVDRGTWWATVYGVTKSETQLKWLSMHAHTVHQWFSSLSVYYNHLGSFSSRSRSTPNRSDFLSLG